MALAIDDQGFLLDEKPLRILSGTIHYFRVPDAYWRDRLRKLKECGFNCVETYVAWNIHEPKEGCFDFTGMADVGRYLTIAQEEGLLALVRPGPYICAEWEFGGFPWWLLKYKMKLRCNDETYLSFVRKYYEQLMAQLRPHLYTNGGNIIAMQVENEYGSYGNDTAYLANIEKMIRDNGIDCLLFTSDGGLPSMLTGGTLKHVFKTVNFGSRPDQNFAELRKVQPKGPLMCTEFWNGWFDHWGEEHHTRGYEDTVETFGRMLEMDASVNFYMFHGGTNFGFLNGANGQDNYQPTVTSYDYDAPVSENGRLTPKWYAVRELVEKQFGKLPAPTVKDPETRAYGNVTFTKSLSLMDNLTRLGKKTCAAQVLTMEELGIGYGYVLYRTHVKGPMEERVLTIQGLADRAQVFVNGIPAGIQERHMEHPEIRISVPEEGICLDILVENMGRINYGPYLEDRKGILGGVRLGLQFLFGWEMYTLPMEQVDKETYEDGLSASAPALLKATFSVDDPQDTFLLTEGFQKGFAVVNGHNIGRYFARGPQKTLYVPGVWLTKGENELIVFEQEGWKEPTMSFIDKPIL